MANHSVVFWAALYDYTNVTQQEAIESNPYGMKVETILYIYKKDSQALDKAVRLTKYFDIPRYS